MSDDNQTQEMHQGAVGAAGERAADEVARRCSLFVSPVRNGSLSMGLFVPAFDVRPSIFDDILTPQTAIVRPPVQSSSLATPSISSSLLLPPCSFENMTMPAMGNFTTEAGVFTVAPFQDDNRPFDIAMLGLKSEGVSTDCYEGWLPSYAMWKGRLYLAELWIMTVSQNLPAICGVYPDGNDNWASTYRGLGLPLGFNGDLEVTTDQSWVAWRGDRDGMKNRFTLTFHGGLLRAADNTSYNIDTTMNHKYCPPVDRPIEHLPLPDRSTPFDEHVIPLTEHEKQQIAEEAEREAQRRARKE